MHIVPVYAIIKPHWNSSSCADVRGLCEIRNQFLCKQVCSFNGEDGVYMKKRILASLLALCLMGGMLPTAALASEPDITMPTTERKLEKNNGAPANRAPSAPASAGAEGNFSEPLLVRAGEEDTPTSGTCGENLTWELDLETGTLTISGTGDMKDYEQVYNGDADYSFSSSSPWSNCDDIKSVIIESGVTSIGKCAFVGCKNLSGILIPNSINDIGDLAFRNCNGLTSISIPDSVSVINPDTFAYCSNLTSISIPNSITGIGWGAFRGCKSLENIIIPQSVVLYIGESAFGDCSSLTSVIIPQGITRIGDKTFSGCYNLTNIMLPKSIDEIDWYAFENCDSLTDIYYAGSEYEWSNIEIDSFRNDALLNATIHYNSTGPDSGDTGTTIPDGRTTVSVKYNMR